MGVVRPLAIIEQRLVVRRRRRGQPVDHVGRLERDRAAVVAGYGHFRRRLVGDEREFVFSHTLKMTNLSHRAHGKYPYLGIFLRIGLYYGRGAH